MSEVTIGHEDNMGYVAELSVEEDERMYKQGLHDFVAGSRDTAEAIHYINYWRNQQIGETAVKSSVQ